MNVQLAFSPCPNDTFIFDALVNKKIDTEGIEFIPVLEDVQTLNQHAMSCWYEVTKLSYGAYALVASEYLILDSGSALGFGVGPILIAQKNADLSNMDDQIIAIPGEHTTAHFLFSLAYPHLKNKIFLPYHQIQPFVSESNGLGVIIHESRFTYEQNGFQKIIDLGAYWEEKYQFPIPLGGIAIKRTCGNHVQEKINRLIKRSIAYSYEQYPLLSEYVKQHAQEMSEDVIRKHIDLYVNEYSMSLGKAGKKAILKMMDFFKSTQHMQLPDTIFWE